MPVSTRTQAPVEDPKTAMLNRNPHHGLKEKMRALTQFYDKHQNQMAGRRSFKNPPEMENKDPNLLPESPSLASKRRVLFPTLEGKENVDGCPDRVPVYPCTGKEQEVPKGGKTMRARKASTERSELGDEGSRIMVYVRLRPMARKEKEGGARCCVKVVDRKDVYLTEFASEKDYLRLKRLKGRHFSFDTSFPDTTPQHEVYSTTAANLVEGVLLGRNGSVFCYGATGAGKTYTMLGTVENPGVMVLAIKDLFCKIRQRSCDGNHVVHLSYLEVYNETVRDLLSPGRPLILREDKQGIIAAGLTQYRAYSTDEVMALLQQGNMNRTTEPTRINETSSRSHAILQVVTEFREKDGDCIVSRIGKLSLIDLAGSERALATDQRTLRSLEGANINRSLLALSSCINALVEGKKHIPYRNSKLTQLLKDSLGGPCNTVMIANISPSNLSFGETQNTLHWADRAKEIKTKGSIINVDLVTKVPESGTDQARLILELQKENCDLRQQLARLQQKLLIVQAQSLAANSSPQKPTPAPKQGKPKRSSTSILSGSCFSTPQGSKRLEANDNLVQEQKRITKILEAELERLKKDHILQLKQKDDFIRQLIKKSSGPVGGDEPDRILTRASTRKGTERSATVAGESRSPLQRFLSPAPTTKKRSFWDSSAASSPSVMAVNGRKTRSHVSTEITSTFAAPSMLPQPGFARQRTGAAHL